MLLVEIHQSDSGQPAGLALVLGAPAATHDQEHERKIRDHLQAGPISREIRCQKDREKIDELLPQQERK